MTKNSGVILALSLLLLLLLPAGAGAEQAVGAKEIAGSWSGEATLVEDTTDDGGEPVASLPITLELDENGTGMITAWVVSDSLVYKDGTISASLSHSEISWGVEVVTKMSFTAAVRRDGNVVTIDGNLIATLEDVPGQIVYAWNAQKEIAPTAEAAGEEDSSPFAGTEQDPEGEEALTSGLESTPGTDLATDPSESLPGDYNFPRVVPRGEGNWIIDWGYDCGCQEEPWEKHAGPLGAAVISVIAAVAAALGASLGSAGGAAAGAAAETLEAAFPEAGALDAPADPSEKDEPAEEPAGDYMLPPEAGFGGPDENPYTSFLSGKGPGDCVLNGLPRYWVNTASLNLVIGDTFFESRGLGPEVSLTLSYNSASEGSGIFGCGWSFSYEWLLEQKGAQVWVHQGSGQSFPFTTAAGANPEQPVEAQPPDGIFHRLIDYGDHWLYIEKGARTYRRFDRVPGMDLGRLTEVSDYYGNRVRLTYSSRGNLETLTDAAGRSIRFIFNEKNLCTGFVLPDGRRASFDYDEQGRLVRTEDLMGIPVGYKYDDASALTKMVTGESERTVAFTYRQVGSERLLSSFSDPNGNVTSYELLSTSPRRVEVTDPEGNKTIFQSKGGLTEQVSDPLGRAAAVEYRGGLPVSHRDRNGGLMRWEYDGAGNQIKEIDQGGAELIFSYDHFGNLTGITDPLGGRWAYRYNDRHSLVGLTSPAGRAISIEYNEQGLPALLGGFGEQKIRYEYDRFGNVVQVNGAAGGTVTLTYDEYGYQPLAVIDALGQSAACEHDDNGRLTLHRHPDGAEKRLLYDCCYSLLSTDERGLSRGYDRDANGNAIKEIDAAAAAAELAYDGNNDLLSHRDRCGRLTRYRYNGARRLTEVLNALGQKQLFDYDHAGNLLSYQMEGGGATRFQYDRCHRRVAVSDPLGAAVSLERDALGRVVAQKGARGKVLGLAYDPDGLPEKIFHDGREMGRFRYDGGGNLIEAADETGTVAFEYDECGRLQKIAYPDSLAVSCSWSAAGPVETITYPGGLTVRYSYDSRMRPAEISWPGGWVRYSYDPAGNLLREERSNGVTSSYEYDQNERMAALKHAGEDDNFIERRYRRDAAGAILEEGGFQPLAPPVDEDFSFSCNPADQIAGSASFRYDADGNLTSAPGWEALYDAENRLVELTRGSAVRQYRYNSLGHRVESGVDGSLRRYGYDLTGNLLFEAEGEVVRRCYLYSHHRPVALIDAAGESLFYHYDQGGNTLALTGSGGEIAAAYAYSPFGLSVCSSEEVDNPFTFSGAYGAVNEGGGLYYMKKRFYSAAWGRFVQRDPLGLAGGTNSYVYGANNPLSHIDPDGTLVIEAWVTWKAVGMVVGGITLAVAAAKTAYSSYTTTRTLDKEMSAAEKAKKAYREYQDTVKRHGQWGGWDEKEAAWRKYEKLHDDLLKLHQEMCNSAKETANNAIDLGVNAITPDALNIPAAIRDYTNRGGGKSAPRDPCRPGVGIPQEYFKGRRLHY